MFYIFIAISIDMIPLNIGKEVKTILIVSPIESLLQ